MVAAPIPVNAVIPCCFLRLRSSDLSPGEAPGVTGAGLLIVTYSMISTTSGSLSVSLAWS